ncbi:Uncharacterized membrane protein YcaP, DUF421 family [Thermanaeromonas toyohensis ToBE]|uniref:Uncharacterized membrane protein YcaP, DUF421 family n=1 Tax=Thermanaeromonas toyohensis ToBE TaxID=698762 RepID=A0A1W1VDX6_9FIRM|nr:DUF421 domain-containing protein [Thermanaeromonas toyohensis]SMB91400.1 Uncharacterized membrane protein YcaP, DUF421 family [Thermanaeromonas toyohensis ToBE]
MENTLEVILQTLLAFAAILIYTRILGKQQVGQLTFFEYINGITFGSIAAALATDIDPDRTWLHFLGLTLFAALTWGAGYVALLSRPARKLISGEPTVVIHNGKILEQNMRKMRYNVDELTMQLRQKNVFDIADVEYAILEPNGNLSVLLKSQKRPLTPADLQVPTEYEGVPTELIVDGEILFENLKQVNLDEKWLEQQLKAQGVEDVSQVDYAVLRSNGSLYVNLKKDQLTTPVDITDTPQSPLK